MATDARGHTVPAASDHPQRQNLLDMMLSVNDYVSVTNTTTRNALGITLAPTTSRPLIVYRVDSGTLELSTNGSAWTTLPDRNDGTWTPVWGSSGTLPAVGNGSFVGDFSNDDRYLDFEMTLTLGTTSTVGSGNYTFTVPIAPIGTGRKLFVGSFIHGGQVYPLICQVIGGTTTMNLFSPAFPVANVTAASPVVPTTGDVYHVTGRYRFQ